MSKADDHFFNVFSVVIGILVVIALFLFVLARSIGMPFEESRALGDQGVAAQIGERTAPFGRVAVAGQDNTALAIVADRGPVGGAPAAALPASAEEGYKVACAACHTNGIAGAPRSGDRAAWAPRIAKGLPTLYDHAVNGFQGQAGVMPAKGGRADLSDEFVREIVDYMVKLNQ